MKEEFTFEEVAPWLVVLITMAGGVLRVLLLGNKGMWLDETISVWLASHSVPELLQWTARIDPHPPLYYLLLHYWIGLNGDSPYTVRLLSALFGAAAIPVIYLIGKRLAGPVVGVAAAVLLAFSPFNIRLAQEARMYTCLTLFASLAIYALLILLTDSRTGRPIGSQFRDYVRVAAWRTAGPVEPEPHQVFSYKAELGAQGGWHGWVARHRWLPMRSVETDLAWVAFIVFTAAALLTHHTAFLFLLAANLVVTGLVLYERVRKPGAATAGGAGASPAGGAAAGPNPGGSGAGALRAPSLANWAKAQIAILVLWSPWLPAFVRQASAVYREFWLPQPSWDTVRETLKSLLNASTATPSQAGLSPLIWAPFGVVLVLALVWYRKKLSQFAFLAALFAIPIAGELLVSLRRPIFYDRTLIWISIPLFVVLAAGVAQLRFRPLIVVGMLTFATINMFSASDYLRFGVKENWNDAAGYVANFAEQGDLVVFNSAMTQIAFDYYFKPYQEKYAIEVQEQGAPDMFQRAIAEPVMTSGDVPTLASLLSGRQRAWLVYSHDAYTDPSGLVPQTLGSGMRPVRQRPFYGGQVLLYEAQ